MNQDQTTDESPTDEPKETEAPVRELPHQESEIPLFLRETADGKKGDAQDEKDKTGE